jgi:hypothetical protein
MNFQNYDYNVLQVTGLFTDEHSESLSWHEDTVCADRMNKDIRIQGEHVHNSAIAFTILLTRTFSKPVTSIFYRTKLLCRDCLGRYIWNSDYF